MPRHSRASGVHAVVAGLTLVLMLAGCGRDDAPQLDDADTVPVGDADAEPAVDTPEETPEASPEAEVDPALAALRDTDAYLPIHPDWQVAREVGRSGGLGSYGKFVPGPDVTSPIWENRAELWAEVVAPIRDDALLAGAPFDGPIWPDEVGGTDAMLQGWWYGAIEHDLYLFWVRFVGDGGEPVQRWHAVVTRRVTQDDGSVAGEVADRYGPFDQRAGDHDGYVAAREAAQDRITTWSLAQYPDD